MATTAVMTQREFVAMLQTAQRVPNYYNNTGGHNLGQFDGEKYSFDCWNLIKAILSGWTPDTPTQRPLVTGDVAGETLLKNCGVAFGQAQDFNQLSIPGTYLYMNGHAGTYIGDVYDTSGHHYNVIECTAWSARGHDLGDSGQLTSININNDGTPKGVIYTYITSTGQRRAYEGGRIGGQWANFGLLPWVTYEGYYPPSTVESDYAGGLAPVQPTSYTNVLGPLSTSENILKRMTLEPRLTPPVMYASGSVYEDGSTNGTYEETTVDANGIATTVTRTQRVKYDGRDMWYAPGGWSPFNGVMDNASYAWCRFSEAMDSDPNNLLIGHVGCQLSRGLACDMYRHEEDGYIRNVACSLGAVMCFYSKKSPDRGYVCIVEDMRENGQIRTSEWVGNRFQVVERQKRYGSWDFDEYVFQGFIHNPACAMSAIAESALDTFCNTAIEAVGESVGWIRKQTEITANNSYSAGLIIAVSKTAGSTLNIIIPNTVSVTGIGRIGVLQNMGTWINGPANKANGRPEVGDIVIIRTQQYKKPTIYQGDVAGIVVEVDADNSFSVVQVEHTVIVKKRYKPTLSRIAGYFRPNWEQIDGTTDSVKLYRNLHGLYTDGVAAEDACAREVCYLKDNLPSIKRSDIKLSAINYTGLLSNMYSVFATSSTSDAADTDLIVDLWTNTIRSWFQEGGTRLVTESASVVRSHQSNTIQSTFTSVEYMIDNLTALTGITPSNFSISNSARIAYEFFTGTAGLSPAASCGILANIQGESHFDCAAAGDYMWRCRKCSKWNSLNTNICANEACRVARGTAPSEPTSFGICQWHFGRGDRMKAAAGANWASNLTGQLEYLLSELRSGYITTYTAISQVSNDIYGAMYAADIFVRKFEVPADPDKASAARQAHAMTFWQGLVQ